VVQLWLDSAPQCLVRTYRASVDVSLDFNAMVQKRNEIGGLNEPARRRWREMQSVDNSGDGPPAIPAGTGRSIMCQVCPVFELLVVLARLVRDHPGQIVDRWMSSFEASTFSSDTSDDDLNAVIGDGLEGPMIDTDPSAMLLGQRPPRTSTLEYVVSVEFGIDLDTVVAFCRVGHNGVQRGRQRDRHSVRA
jgi:hypothetical protein